MKLRLRLRAWAAKRTKVGGRGPLHTRVSPVALTTGLLMNATLLFNAGAVIMTPDTPLLFFWTCCLWALARVASGGGEGPWWLAAGCFAGLAMVGKYSASLLLLGIALWVLLTPTVRKRLRRPEPWIGGALGLLVFAPVVVWNGNHGWISFMRQGARAATWEPGRAARFIGELLAGQAALATPLIFTLCVAGIVKSGRQAWTGRDPKPALLLALTLPTVVVVTQHAFGDRVQGNWPAIAYPAAIVAAASLSDTPWQRLFGPAIALGAALSALIYLHAISRLVPLPARLDPVALRLEGWDGVAAQIESAAKQMDARFVAAPQYGVASELAWTVSRDFGVAGVDPRWPLLTLPIASLAGDRVILVAQSEARDGSMIGSATRLSRDGTRIETFRLYLVDGSTLTASELPRP